MSSIPTQEEMATLQRLSDNYVPDVEGPLVGSKQPISTLIAQYANADPVYVQKTAALPQSFSQWRSMRGDGNCGWRAVSFQYFEELYRQGDRGKIESEIHRLTALNTLISQAGYDEMTFSDFAEVTIELLQRTMDALLNGLGDEFLVESFSDEGTSSAIIMHFRLLASAHMKSNPDQYAPFLPMPLDQYCATHIDPFKVEIEHTGLAALMNVVIGPAGFRMEITYLDRTPGSQANTISFDPDNPVYTNPPTIRLLFKPDHYDILYRSETTPNQTVYQVQRATIDESYQPYGIQPSFDTDLMYLHAGFSTIASPSQPSTSFSAPTDLGYNYAPTSTIPASVSPMTSPISPTSPPLTHLMTSSASRPSSTPSMVTSMASPVTPPAAAYSPIIPIPPTDRSKHQIRMVTETHLPMPNHPIQTRPFKDSEYNRIHYLNPGFQPEQYRPSDYEASQRSSQSRSRRE